MASETEGNIFLVKEGIICHQVNCMGVMGSGLALAIRKEWPVVYESYVNAHRNGDLIPGHVHFVQVGPEQRPGQWPLVIANLCGQQYYGGNGNYTIYSALEQCLMTVRAFSAQQELPVWIPYKMSCGLAGGDWEGVVLPMIERCIPWATIVKRI